MQVKIKNSMLAPSIELLYPMSLKGKESRHRTKFIKALNDRLQEVAEHENSLLKEHCHLDEKGNPKKIEDGKKWDVKDLDAFLKDKKELYEEELVIEGGDAQGMLKTMGKVLENCNQEFSGQEATVYDYLCDQFEEESEQE